MPGPRSRRRPPPSPTAGSLTQRTPTEQAQRARPGTQRYKDAMAAAATTSTGSSATPREAAKEFVEKHVRFDADTGLPSLLDSAVEGIAHAVDRVEAPSRSESSVPSVSEAGGNTGNRIDTPGELKRIQREIKERGGPSKVGSASKPEESVSKATKYVNRMLPELEVTPGQKRNPELSDFSNREQAKMREQREEKLKTPKYKSEMTGGAYGLTGRYKTPLDPALQYARPAVEVASLFTPSGLAKQGLLRTVGKTLLTKEGRAVAAKEAAEQGISKTAVRKGLVKKTRTGKIVSGVRSFTRHPATRALKGGAAVGATAGTASTGHLGPAVEGLGQAIKDSPGKTAETTARGAIGLVTGPLSVGAAGATSLDRLARGKKDPFRPALRLGDEMWNEAKQEWEVFTSKDADKIAKGVTDDYGLWPYLGAAALGRAAMRDVTNPIYRAGREKARGAVQAKRQPPYPIPDDAPAPPIFPRIENFKQGRRIAVRGAREEARKGAITARAMGPVHKRTRRIRGDAEGKELYARLEDFSKRKSNELKKPVAESPDSLIPYMARSAITNESPEAALAELDLLEADLDRRGAPADAPERLKIEALREAPELLTRPEKMGRRPTGVGAFWDAVDAYRKGSAEVPGAGRSPIARRVPIAVQKERLDPDADPILRPEVAPPILVRGLPDAPRNREEAVGRGTSESYRKSDLGRARRELKAEMKKAEPDAHKVLALQGRIAVLDKTMGRVTLTASERKKALVDAGLPTTPRTISKVGDSKVTAWSPRQRGALMAAQQAKRVARDEEVLTPLRKEFMDLTDEEIRRRKLEEPALIAQRSPTQGLDSGVTFERAGVGKDQYRSGALQRQGRIVEEYGDLARTVAGNARRDAQMRNSGWFIDTYKVERDLGEGQQDTFVKAQQDRMAESGYLGPNPEKDYVRVATSYFDDEAKRDALFGADDPKAAWREVEKNAQKVAAEGQGLPSYIFPRGAWDHFLGQQQALTKYGKWLSKAMTVQSRALLATSFAWMVTQPFAEAIPLLFHDPNPARMIRATKYVLDARKDPKRARDLAFAADTTPGGDPATRTAKGYQTQTHRSINAIKHTPGGHVITQALKGEYIVGIDRAKGALFREIGYVMELDKELNSKARQFTKAVAGIFDDIDKVSDKLRTMDRAEQIHWLNNTKEGQKAGEAFRVKLDEALGNWTALTPGERMISHAIIFYPFVRFSLDWTFRTFPKRHPVRFAIAGQMGQWNSEILERFLTHKPGFFSGWATVPIFTTKEGPPTAIFNATRFSPGGNPFVEAAGDAESLGDLIKSTAPYIKIPMDVATGRNIYGDPIEEGGERSFTQDIKNLGEHLGASSFPSRFGMRVAGDTDSPGRQGDLEYLIRSGVVPFLPEDFKRVKDRATVSELWEKRTKAKDIAEAPYPDDIENVAKFGEWREEDKDRWTAIYKSRGLSEEKAEEKAEIASMKDIERYLKKGTKPDNPNYDQYKKYLSEYLKKKTAERDVDKYTRRLVKMYGNAGVDLTKTLRTAYSEDIDTGRSGPKAQREAGNRPMPAADILPRYTTNTAPKYGEEDRVRLNSKAAQAKKPAAPKQAAAVTPKSAAKKPAAKPAAKAMKVNKKIAEKIGDDRLTPEMVGEFARAAKVTGVPASILAGIHRKEQAEVQAKQADKIVKTAVKEPKLAQSPGLKKDPMSNYTVDEAATLLYQVGASKEEAETLSSILQSESGGNPRAANPTSGARGLFQVMTSRDDQEWGWDGLLKKHGAKNTSSPDSGAFDPVVNARAALEIFRGSGGSLGPWEGAAGTPGRVNPRAKQGVLASGPTLGGTAFPTVKNPNKRPFKGLMPMKVDELNINRGMSEAKWDKIPAPGHGDTDINKAIAPIARAFQKKYGIMYGEGYAPPPSDHKSAEHLVTGTALDVYPRNENWDENSKEFKDFKKGIETLTAAGIEVLYDGSINGTTPYPNHGYGNHAHIKWLGADGKTGLQALQKLTGMTNQQIANISASVGAGGGGTSYAGGGGTSSGGGGTSSGGGGASGGGGGGSSSSSSYSPPDLSKLSASLTIPDVTGSLPTVSESPSVMEALKKLPDIPKARRRKRTYV